MSARKNTTLFLQMQASDGGETSRSHFSANLKSTIKAPNSLIPERTISQKVIANFQKVIGRGGPSALSESGFFRTFGEPRKALF
jgi:hypothetical protein